MLYDVVSKTTINLFRKIIMTCFLNILTFVYCNQTKETFTLAFLLLTFLIQIFLQLRLSNRKKRYTKRDRVDNPSPKVFQNVLNVFLTPLCSKIRFLN